jgi:NTP pyrophosphatase (non-canonical NTP hydrolase)
MDLKEYQQWVKDTSLYPSGLNYPVGQLCAESGEAMGIVLKMERKLHTNSVLAADLPAPARLALIGELSDALWSVTASLNELGITLEELANYNFEKLEERRRDGTLYNKEPISSDALALRSAQASENHT